MVIYHAFKLFMNMVIHGTMKYVSQLLNVDTYTAYDTHTNKVAYGYIDILKYLLEKKCPMESDIGKTARRYKQVECLKLLKNK